MSAPAASAPRASNSGSKARPPPAASTGGTGIGWGGGAVATGGATSVTGSTQLAGAWAAAATAAAPHSAAAGAPPVMAVSAAHGLICGAGAELDAATAPVELTNKDPAMTAPTSRLARELPMTILPGRGRLVRPRELMTTLSPK